MKDNPNPAGPLASWAAVLKDGILIPELDDGTLAALGHHLADLGFWEKEADDLWRISLPAIPSESDALREEIRRRLHALAKTERGFALNYFLPNASIQGLPGEPDVKVKEDRGRGKQPALHRKTSDPSNLQIVNKYGRQMESFIELEKNLTEKLVGKHTGVKQARKIINHILNRMNAGAEPRPWEQLSRRRHR